MPARHATAPAHEPDADPAIEGFVSDTPVPRRSAAAPPPKHRAGKSLAGGYIEKDDLYIIKELLLRLSRELKRTVTMQDFAVSAFTRECARYGVKLSGKSGGPLPDA
ncbi:MAG: hypothetical protein JO001_10265 [Alphaproteobacteria bacterium]|nr:hypothetical protein [Alphaproteobacteria bacterium]